jgi:protein KRI1
LVSYILNRGWIDRSAGRLPTYAEVTDIKKNKKGKSKAKAAIEAEVSPEDEVPVTDGDAEDDAEDNFDELTENFEASYNFRFEEP